MPRPFPYYNFGSTEFEKSLDGAVDYRWMGIDMDVAQRSVSTKLGLSKMRLPLISPGEIPNPLNPERMTSVNIRAVIRNFRNESLFPPCHPK